jgi:hypothetical protein
MYFFIYLFFFISLYFISKICFLDSDKKKLLLFKFLIHHASVRNEMPTIFWEQEK